MTRTARVAVITRTKDRPVTLKRAIASVAGQTYGDYLHVIVNDGGDPKAVEALVAGGGNAKQTVIMHNPRSLGMEAASNAGIRSCQSEYILIHDDDDTLHPQFLEKALSFMDGGDSLYCGVSTWITLVKESIDGDKITRLSERLYSSLKSVSIGQMAASNQLVPIAFLYKRSIHEQIGYYDETLPVLGDWDFFLRVLEKHEICILPETLAYYHQRVSADGIYANSLTGALDKHAVYSQIVRNKMFRREMENGKPGVGLLCQMSSMMLMLPEISAEYYAKCVANQIGANRPGKIAIYGTGDTGAKLHREIVMHGLNVGCFVENNRNLNGDSETFIGLPVLSLDAAIENGFLDIAVGSWEYKNAVIDRIHKEIDVSGLRVRLYSV